MPEDRKSTQPPGPPAEAPPDSIHGKSIELPKSNEPLPDFARPPTQRPKFDPRVLVPLDLLDPHVPGRRELDEKRRAEAALRRKILLGVGGGLGAGVLLALMGLLIYQHQGDVASPTFDEGVVVSVDSEPPGASVFIDGRPTGLITPTKLKNWDFSLPHHVRIELEGFYPDDHVIIAEPHPADIVAKLPKIAHLVTRSTPPGASVFLGEREMGVTPVDFDVPAGRDVAVGIKLAGYIPVTQHVVLQTDEKALREFTLHTMAVVSIKSEPQGARCSVDAQPEVSTPADFYVEAGVPHVVRLTAASLPPQERKVTVKEGRREQLVFHFEDPRNRKIHSRIDALHREAQRNQRKLDAMEKKTTNGPSEMFSTFGRLKDQNKLEDAVDRDEGEEQRLIDEISGRQVELEDQLKADNVKDGVPPGTLIPVQAADDKNAP